MHLYLHLTVLKIFLKFLFGLCGELLLLEQLGLQGFDELLHGCVWDLRLFELLKFIIVSLLTLLKLGEERVVFLL